jgi:hypothetical protein
LNPDAVTKKSHKCGTFLIVLFEKWHTKARRHGLVFEFLIQIHNWQTNRAFKGKFLPERKRSFPMPWVSFGKLSGLSTLFPQSKNFNRYALGYLGEKENHSVVPSCLCVPFNFEQTYLVSYTVPFVI